jgi:alpha-galactosidase
MNRLDGEYYRLMKTQSSNRNFHRCATALVFLFLGLLAQPAFAVITASPDEMATAQAWWAKYLGAESPRIPFSFRYGDQPVDSLLAGWKKTTHSEQLPAGREQHTITWKDPKTGLEVRSVAVRYGDFPVVEWTVYFKNAGAVNTPILADIQALDVAFQRPAGKEEFVLNGNKGDFETADSYEPFRRDLSTKSEQKFSPGNSGKSSGGPTGWPYFNLQIPGEGVIIAVGWPGQWAGSFTRDASTGLTVRAGQELTHLYLKPGEEIRTPLIAMLFWKGADVVRSQNVWRRWYLAHNLPRTQGVPQPPVAQVGTSGSVADIPRIEAMLAAGIQLDNCWRDAQTGGEKPLTWWHSETGPYNKTVNPKAQPWWNTGTWDIDRTKYPEGFKPFSDWAHSRGLTFMLWFEPERVGNPNSWLAKNHPEWLLPPNEHTYGVTPSRDPILDLGNPAALKWLTDHVDAMIKSEGIDWYREDMNGGGPLWAWRKTDDPDRQGITENLYIQGHLQFWDELRRRHPHLRIDSCASGGRRNDLETMRRAVPLLRSDFVNPEKLVGVVEGNQGHTYGLSSWLPFQGSGSRLADSYSYRSFFLPSYGMHVTDLEVQKKARAEWRRIANAMLLGDYYPLTSYSLQRDHWIAWQFDQPEKGEGVVQAFRRPESPYESARFKLRGLDAAATYAVENFDGGTEKLTGQELMERGLAVTAATAPTALIFIYKRSQ